MHCYDCLKKDWCPYIYQFNHDPRVGCLAFQDKDYTTYVSNTLNIENPKISKELETLDELYSVYFDNDVVKSKYGINEKTAKEKYEIIKTALKRMETLEEDFMSLTETNMKLVQELSRNRKKIRVVDIIRAKLVDFNKLNRAERNWKEDGCASPVEYYNEGIVDYCQLTQEEYDLLKEVIL